MTRESKTVQATKFAQLLKDANKEAAMLSAKTEHPEVTHGNAVVVFGIEGKMRRTAVKLGALDIESGLLFLAAPEGAVAQAPRIRNHRLWAYWFCGILASAGFSAKLIEYVGEDTYIRV